MVDEIELTNRVAQLETVGELTKLASVHLFQLPTFHDLQLWSPRSCVCADADSSYRAVALRPNKGSYTQRCLLAIYTKSNNGVGRFSTHGPRAMPAKGIVVNLRSGEVFVQKAHGRPHTRRAAALRPLEARSREMGSREVQRGGPPLTRRPSQQRRSLVRLTKMPAAAQELKRFVSQVRRSKPQAKKQARARQRFRTVLVFAIYTSEPDAFRITK